MSPANISPILERIAAAGAAYQNNELGAREELMDLSSDLIASLQIPSEFLARSFWAEPALAANCKLAVQVFLFQHLRDAGETGITVAELSKKTGVEIQLLSRIMRHFISMKLVTFASSTGTFHGTTLTDGLAEEKYQRSIDFNFDVSRPPFGILPSLFKRLEYRMPTEQADTPFQVAHNTDLDFFAWIDATPPHLANFNAFMSAYADGKPGWWDPEFYPVEERLLQGFDPSLSDVLLVDVGGGRGHDLVQFAARHPHGPGKLVLQDREPVIAMLQPKSNSEGAENGVLPFVPQTHDFFTPQPVMHARAYSLHSVLHDWVDDVAVRVVENLTPALKKGYSRVLIVENVVNEKKPSVTATSMDMMMLAHMDRGVVRERTEGDWRALVERAGLKIVGIYEYPGAGQGVIEAELA